MSQLPSPFTFARRATARAKCRSSQVGANSELLHLLTRIQFDASTPGQLSDHTMRRVDTFIVQLRFKLTLDIFLYFFAIDERVQAQMLNRVLNCCSPPPQ